MEALKEEERKRRRVLLQDLTDWSPCYSFPTSLTIWVKVKCQLEALDEDIIYDYLQGFSVSNDERILIIMVQEYVAYEQLQANYFDYCKNKKKKIQDKLLELVDETSVSWFQRSRVLGLCGRLEDCIECLSLAVESLEEESHELAVAYCFRACCTQENDPKSKRVLEDINTAIGIWLAMEFSVETLPKNLMIVFFHVLDLVSIKGCKDVDGIYEVIFRLLHLSVDNQSWLGILWGSRRTSHAFCASPVSEAFMKILLVHYGEESDSTSFWLDHLEVDNQYESVVAGFELFSTPWKYNDAVQKAYLLRKKDGSDALCISAYYYHDLSERLASMGHLAEALSHASQAFRRRWRLFQKTFDDESLKVSRTSANILWSYDTLEFNSTSFCLSPWKILECYLESLLQLGVIRELNGERQAALHLLTLGKKICNERFPVLRLRFSSVIGRVYCREKNLDSAKTELEDTIALFNSVEDFPCEKCRLSLAGSVFQNPLAFSDSRRTAALVQHSDVEEGWKFALTNLKHLDWKNTVSCSDFPSNLEFSVNCICKSTRGCWHCLHQGVFRSNSVNNMVYLKWELVRRHLSLRLFAGLGKFLENDTETHATDGISKDMSLLDVILQSMSLLVSRDAFSPAISTDLFLGMMGKDIAGFDLSVELAELIYNICWWSLQARSDRTRRVFSDLADNDLAKDLPRLVSWLVLEFVICREVPILFQKVAKLLATMCALNYTILDHDKHSILSSCRDLEYFTPKWASFFHQASLASDVPGSTQRNLAPEKVADLPQFVTSFFEGLPYTPVICLSVIGGCYASLLQQLLSSDSSGSHHREAWILITRLKWDRKPITLFLPISEIIQGGGRDWDEKEITQSWICPWGSEGSTEIEDIIPEFRTILERLHLSERLADLQSLDHRLEKFMGRLEDLWFGYAKDVLLGEWSSCQPLYSVYERLKKKLGSKKTLNDDRTALNSDVKALIGSSKRALNGNKFLLMLQSNGIVNLPHKDMEQIKKEVKMLEDMKSVVREPIILVLDPQVQMLPFERLPIMRDQEVYRMPSVGSIFNIMKKHSESQIPFIDPKQSFVLLNPDQSFPNAEELLLPQLTSNGVMVRTHKDIPSHEEFSELLNVKDLYVFVGHNSGIKYFPVKKLEKVKDCAAAFLMGCANGSSNLRGYYPPYCVPLSYLFAGAPLVVCTLWEIVSRENSLFTWRLIELLFQERSKPQRERRTIGALVNKVRSGSTLKYVDGPHICYGVPTAIIEKVKP